MRTFLLLHTDLRIYDIGHQNITRTHREKVI